jgi:hypothetical protein
MMSHLTFAYRNNAMSKTTTDLALIARSGGGITISSAKTTADLSAIARAGIGSGAFLIIREAGKKTTADLCAIAAANPGHVLFEFD